MKKKIGRCTVPKRRRPPAHIVEAAGKLACPDCDSEISLRWDEADGIWHTGIGHDDECPQLAFRERHGATTGFALVADPGRTVTKDAITNAVKWISDNSGADRVRVAMENPADSGFGRSEMEFLKGNR